MRYTVFLFLLSAVMLLPQSKDSLRIFTNSNLRPDTARTAKDTLSVPDSLKNRLKAPKDTLKPVSQRAMTEHGYYITKESFLRENYNTTNNILEGYPLSFNKSYGFALQPDETYINGSGLNSTAYYLDGTSLNSDGSWFNPLFIQTENIDSVEIIPAARSFLYGVNNSFAGINFLSKNKISATPYTRIRYKEGPNREGALDAQYSSVVFKKFALSFDLTSMKVEDQVVNSNSSIWQGNAKIKYFFTDKLNIVTDYNYTFYTLGLTDGVNAGYLDSLYSNLKDAFYGANTAIPNDNYSYNKSTSNSISTKLLSTYLDSNYTDLTFYYRAHLDEYRQNEHRYSDKIPVSVKNIRTKIFAGKLQQLYKAGFLNFDFAGNFQTVKYNSDNLVVNNWEGSYSVSGKMSAGFFDGNLTAALFAKTGRYNGNALGGVGADIGLKLNRQSELYVGGSSFDYMAADGNIRIKMPVYFYTDELLPQTKINVKIGEAGFKYFNKPLMLNAKLIYRYEDNSYDYFGGALGIALKYWKLSLENTTSVNDMSDSDNGSRAKYIGPVYYKTDDILPKLQTTTGIFYTDILFDKNLDLKTGVTIKYLNLKKDLSYYDYGLFKQNIFLLNFELSGEIQKTAILYFTWENLLNTKYYIIPFYPMQQRAIRFGVAWSFLN